MHQTLSIAFEIATIEYHQTIMGWLNETHVKEFWDNSDDHKDDILIFMNGRKDPSPYMDGMFTYWIGFVEKNPYCLLMTSEVLESDKEIPKLWIEHLSKIGRTFTIDFMIGNRTYFGKGLAAPTLKAFVHFINISTTKTVDTFIIDPVISNTRARHVYEKAGFEVVGNFYHSFSREKEFEHILMIKRLIT